MTPPTITYRSIFSYIKNVNAKKIFYGNLFDQFKSKARKTWDIVKQLIHKNYNL